MALHLLSSGKEFFLEHVKIFLRSVGIKIKLPGRIITKKEALGEKVLRIATVIEAFRTRQV
jgi:hypothetical protein